MTNQEIQDKNQEMQQKETKAEAITIAYLILGPLINVIPSWFWDLWNKTMAQTTETDLDNSTLAQLKDWGNASTATLPPD